LHKVQARTKQNILSEKDRFQEKCTHMKQGQTIYQIQKGDPSAEQYAIRIESIDDTGATLRAKYAGARPFHVNYHNLRTKYTTLNLTEQAAAEAVTASQASASASASPAPDPKKKVTLEGGAANDGGDTTEPQGK
jgi:hypothetical protein